MLALVRGRIGRFWRWLSAHDPFSITAAWLIPHRAILGWVSLAWLLVMLPFAVLRWNALATLWGVIGAGLLVSVILQEQGEAIQRRVWLRRNRASVDRWVGLVNGSAGLAVTAALGLGDAIDVPLRMGPTVVYRRRAIEQAREVARSFSTKPEIQDARRYVDFPTWVLSLSTTQAQLRMAISNNGPLFDRLTELHGAIRELRSDARFSHGDKSDGAAGR
jgi:hypothetical protein